MSSLLNHIKTNHKGSEEVNSPLGNFSSSNSARVLFNDHDQPSTQGNSHGEVNSPKVMSVTSYQCGNCDMHFNRNDEAKLHISNDHPNKSTPKTPAPTPTPTSKPYSPGTELSLQDQAVVMEEAKEEQDLYDALDFITQNVIDPDTEKETRDDMKIKLDRY